MSRWWFGWGTADRETIRQLRTHLERARKRAEELEELADQRADWLRDARSYSATVEQAGQELGEKLQQAETRLGQALAVLAMDRLPPDVRLAKVHQALTGGRPVGDAE